VVAVDRGHYRAVLEDQDLTTTMADLRAQAPIGVALRARGAGLLGVSLSSKETAVYVPLMGRPEARLDADNARKEVFKLLADPSVPKVGHDTKEIDQQLRRVGGCLFGVAGDTKLLDYVLVAHRRTHGLDTIATRHLGHTLGIVPEDEPLILSDLVLPAVEQADVARILHGKLESRLEDGTRAVYETIELPLLPVLAEMEQTGIGLDLDSLAEVERDLRGRVSQAEAHCHELAGHPFKVGSPAEVGKVLFEELGLPKSRKTRTGNYSTDSSVLEGLAEHHELPMAILDYRQLSKLVGTYLARLPTFVDSGGRVHTTFNQAVAATGRLSSTDPNLQNIPVRTFEGRRIRQCFVPKEGCVFLSADYSQIELRVLAHFTASETLVGAFQRGEDIHRRTASEVWGTPLEEVTSEQRSNAKAINFGLLYGMSAFRLGRDLAIPRAEAEEYMERYFARLPAVQQWIADTKASCREVGFVETMFGRRRLIPEIYSKNFNDRSMGEREAVNTRVQGTAADIVKIAMLRVHKRLRETGMATSMLLQVHDELLLEVPEEERDRAEALVVEAMMAAADLAVPLEVNTAFGANWNEAHG
jgi:DNA polymerase-1